MFNNVARLSDAASHQIGFAPDRQHRYEDRWQPRVDVARLLVQAESPAVDEPVPGGDDPVPHPDPVLAVPDLPPIFRQNLPRVGPSWGGPLKHIALPIFSVFNRRFHGLYLRQVGRQDLRLRHALPGIHDRG